MTIAMGCDHGGFALKEHLKSYLEEKGYQVEDCGCHSTESVDYPVYGKAAAQAVAEGRCQYGIVICTTGIGISITANKVKGIRCSLCRDVLSAELTRKHNNANMLALAGGFTGPFESDHIVAAFLDTEFGGGRHERRGNKLMALED